MVSKTRYRWPALVHAQYVWLPQFVLPKVCLDCFLLPFARNGVIVDWGFNTKMATMMIIYDTKHNTKSKRVRIYTHVLSVPMQ